MTQQGTNITKYGRYEVRERIGEGGFGMVFRGHDAFLDRDVAIKVLRPDLSEQPEFIRRFRNEAKTTAALRHANIVAVFETGEECGRFFIAMDYLPGGTLAKRMEKGKALSLANALQYLTPIAGALDYAHSKKLIHRDIKPGNILFNEDGQPVLTDFGLVKLTEDISMTTTGAVLGTVEYMAPEQIQAQELTPATDLYALAVIAYQMLTGLTPFTGKSPFEIQLGHVNQSPAEPCSIRPELPREINTILLKALSKHAEDRYPSGKAFIDDLQRVANQANQQAASMYMKDAARKASQLDFDGAISAVRQAQAVAESAEQKALIVEYTRKKERYEEYLRLGQEIEDAQKSIDKSRKLRDELLNSEPWIVIQSKKEPKKNIETKSLPKDESISTYMYKWKPLENDPVRKQSAQTDDMGKKSGPLSAAAVIGTLIGIFLILSGSSNGDASIVIIGLLLTAGCSIAVLAYFLRS